MDYEQLTLNLGKHVAALETANTKKKANRATLLIESTLAKMRMIETHRIPAMEQETGGEFYDEQLEETEYWTDPDAQWFFEQEDVQLLMEEKLGKHLIGEVVTDDDNPSDDGPYYVEARTRVGTVFGAGQSWFEAVARAAAAFQEIRKRSQVEIKLIPQKLANDFVAKVHRHHDPPVGDKFRLGAFSNVNGEETLIGVAIVGRPVSRKLEEKHPTWLELTRMATLAGTASLNSQLYMAAWRETQKRKNKKGQPYDKLITYISENEPGTSLKATQQWYVDYEQSEGGKWGREKRPRADHHPTEPKVRWAISKNRPKEAAP